MGKNGPATVHGTWEDLFRAIAAGTYAAEYEIGEVLPLDLGAQGEVGAQIAAFDADMLADDSSYAPVTFVSFHVLNTGHRINPALSPSEPPYTEGTGAIGGWGASEIRSYCANTILPIIPAEISNRIATVKKYSFIVLPDGTSRDNNDLTEDKIWIPSEREVGESWEQLGPAYTSLFPNNNSRIKTKSGDTTGVGWWLRTTSTVVEKWRVALGANGTTTNYKTNFAGYYLAIGFCIA